MGNSASSIQVCQIIITHHHLSGPSSIIYFKICHCFIPFCWFPVQLLCIIKCSPHHNDLTHCNTCCFQLLLFLPPHITTSWCQVHVHLTCQNFNILRGVDTFSCFFFNIRSVHFCLQSASHNPWIAWTPSQSCNGDIWMLLESYLSELLLLLICCTSREVLSGIYRLSHVQNTLQGFCAGLSFMQHYIFPFPHGSFQVISTKVFT